MKQPCRETRSESSKSWHGKLNLVYGDRQNKTRLIKSKNQAQMKQQRTLKPKK